MPDDTNAEVLQRLTRVETKVDGMDSKLDRAIQANETAVEALSSARSAHKRHDELAVEIKELKEDRKWLWRAVVSSVIVAIVGFVISGGLK